MGSVADPVASTLHLDYAAVGSLIGFYLLPGVVLAIPSGLLGRWASDRVLVALGLLALTVGQFAPMRLRGSDQGLTGTLHLVEGAVAMLMVVTAMGFAATALDRRFRFYTIATIALMLAFGAWSGVDAPHIEAGLATPWVGVKERIFWYAYQLWFMVLALTLLRQPVRVTEPR